MLNGVAIDDLNSFGSTIGVEYVRGTAIDLSLSDNSALIGGYNPATIDFVLSLYRSNARLSFQVMREARIYLDLGSTLECDFCFGSVSDLSLDSGTDVQLNRAADPNILLAIGLPLELGTLSMETVRLRPDATFHYGGLTPTEIGEVIKYEAFGGAAYEPVTIANIVASCSATQEGSSVLITCADGTSGVLAGAGTVVTYPEGGILGEAPIQSWPAGTIVFRDNSGIELAEAKQVGTSTVFEVDGFRGTFVNLPDQEVVMTGWGGGTEIYYLTSDCSGQAFGVSGSFLYEAPNGLAVSNLESETQSLLSNSYLDSGWGNFSEDYYRSPGNCVTSQSVIDARPLIEYTPAAELLNPAYPVVLEQLP